MRGKLAKEKRSRIEALELQIMEEKATLPELNQFEQDQAAKRIKGTLFSLRRLSSLVVTLEGNATEWETQISYTPEDAQLFDLDMEERADKVCVGA